MKEESGNEVNGQHDEDVKMEDAGPQNVEYVSEQLDVKDPSLEAFSNVLYPKHEFARAALHLWVLCQVMA